MIQLIQKYIPTIFIQLIQRIYVTVLITIMLTMIFVIVLVILALHGIVVRVPKASKNITNGLNVQHSSI
jgi:heme/copper-type cytochrome/quinol oxidase subunit 2